MSTLWQRKTKALDCKGNKGDGKESSAQRPSRPQPHLIGNHATVPDPTAIHPYDARAPYGFHLLDHLAADRTGLAGGQIAVVALLEVDADLP